MSVIRLLLQVDLTAFNLDREVSRIIFLLSRISRITDWCLLLPLLVWLSGVDDVLEGCCGLLAEGHWLLCLLRAYMTWRFRVGQT